MSNMNPSNISTKDLNLLTVFDAVFRNSNVTLAAEELSLSQSAVSHALTRLRDLFEDPLFTRLPRGISPTPKALELAPKIAAALENLGRVFETTAFAPENAKGRIAIASSEFLEVTVLSEMFLSARKSSPQLVFQFRNASGKLPKLALEKGEIDIAIAGYFGNLPEGFYQQKLFENDFVCIARKNHPLIKSKLTLDLYASLEHLLISPQGDLYGLIDERLLPYKKTRKVVAGFENYLTPAWLVAESQMVISVSRTLGEFYEKNFKVSLHELPFPSPKITLVQAWHERTHSNPLHKHVRGMIAEHTESLRKTTT